MFSLKFVCVYARLEVGGFPSPNANHFGVLVNHWPTDMQYFWAIVNHFWLIANHFSNGFAIRPFLGPHPFS